MTQAQLARKAGCTKSAVSQWESGDVDNLKLHRLFLVADALKVEPRWLAIAQGPESATPASQEFPDEIVRIARHIYKLGEVERAALLGIFERVSR